jgi:hypothetical protein
MNIRVRLQGLRKEALQIHSAYTPLRGQIVYARCRVFGLGASAAKRAYAGISRDESWYGSPDSWDKAKQWLHKGSCARMGVPVVWSTAPSLSRDLCAPILFLDDVRALIEHYDLPNMPWTERRDMVEKHGLTHHHRLNQIWLPDHDDGGISVGYWTDPDEVRRAFAAWRASEAALTAIRDELKTFRASARKRMRSSSVDAAAGHPKKRARKD